MNCKNDDDKTAFPNENSSLDDSENRFHTAKDSLLYIQCPKIQDIFMETRKTTKECAVTKVKRHTLVSNIPNYLKISTNIKTETNLHHTEKRTCIKKVKCRRKIKSPENDYITNNHDKMLDAKSEDRCLDKSHQEFCKESHKCISKRIKYPNYLKASSRLKGRSGLHTLNNNMKRMILQSENGDEKVQSDNCYLLIKDRQIELLEENEKLKNKLKTIIESLREILGNHGETESEIKLLKDYSSCHKKQTKCPNDYFLLTLINQRDTFKNTDVFKKSNQRTNHPSLTCQIVPLNDVLYTSANIFASERTKVQDSNQCLIELEKQNRIIIRSLNELKDSFRKFSELKFTEVKSSNSKNHHYRTANRIRTNKISKFAESPVTVQRKTAVCNKSAIPSKKQSEMLREMIKFNKLLKNNEYLKKDNQHINHLANLPKNGDSAEKEQILKSKQNCSPPLSSNAGSKNNVKTSAVQKKYICKKDAVKKFCKMANNDNPQTQQAKLKRKIHNQYWIDCNSNQQVRH